MKFYDKVSVEFIGGNGGNGCATSRKEKYIAFGWPAGWDGGKWWDIILVWSKDENTLIDFKYKKKYSAHHGEHWQWHDKYGKNADDIILKVPLWTVVKDNIKWNNIFQFIQDWQEFKIVKWWKWWLWNIHFKNSRRQYPNFALLWEIWEYKDVTLEIQLLGDVALIWTPSVGKSTIINSISNTKAKVWDYPFTTLVPNLGIIKYQDYNFSMVDVPWLIKWASEWKWLGNEFLKHILKAKCFCFVLDISKYENGIDELEQLFEEIKYYIHTKFLGSIEYGFRIKELQFEVKTDWENIYIEVIVNFNWEKIIILKKLLYFTLNKYDLINDMEILEEYKKLFLQKTSNLLKISWAIIQRNLSVISWISKHGTQDFIKNLAFKSKSFENVSLIDFDLVQVDEKESSYIKEITEEEMNCLIEQEYIDESQANHTRIWEIMDKEVCQNVFSIPWWNDQAEFWFWLHMEKEWILKNWEKNGIIKWDILKIKSFYHQYEDKYIMWI